MDTANNTDPLREEIIKVLRTVFDPEIPVNIYELGLVYKVDISDEGKVHVDMTLTAPNCPAAGQLPIDVQTKVKSVPGVKDAEVKVVWEPQWNKEMMSEAAKLQLGFM
ncbi:SUF system Fe-S cluster assembly protein [Candidatus Sumerlaeota bacterium]|nr:SUF system Fe-S cluster assembly protein [Candidatus Sumerlaeota bacterium]MBI3735841.1 SUF system Fe-S cluster assembly protein [Candidatus Sumerlaeota bacterium]